jgi:hypothetical protein
MSAKRSPARDGGAVGYDNNEPGLDTKSNIGFQADNNQRYSKPIFSSRIRLIGIQGFRRRRRWRAPFTASIFQVERRLLVGGAP